MTDPSRSDQSGPSASVSATGCVYDPIFLAHDLAGHPEHAGRLEAIVTELRTAGLWELMTHLPVADATDATTTATAATDATDADLSAVHTETHIARVTDYSRAGRPLDGDTYTCAQTAAAARRAAGSLVALCRTVLRGELPSGFALVRPPGHHATPTSAMGFCIFNNVAIAARAALRDGGAKRVAIIDFDVHHGNGTQDAFYSDADVLYVSSHQYPHYPGSGAAEETGSGQAVGTTLNIPLPSGVGDDGFARIYDEIVTPAVRRFRPDLILVSAGYDAHWADPLAGLMLTCTGHARLARTLIDLAAELCGGRIVFTLEGGYNLDALAHGVANAVRALLGRDDLSDPLGSAQITEPDLSDVIADLKMRHRL